ncbi:nucleotidyl transferase AbiEii/AbiGii toxin family protein [Desulfosalsimonas propionicica]
MDFDFFSDRPLNKTLIYTHLPLNNNAVVLQEEPHTLTLLLDSGQPGENDVKVSFFGTIGIGRINDPDITDDGILQVASMNDLLATKLKVILQRIETKDYRDIAVLINAGASLPKGIAAARLMYGLQFQPMESLKALTHFKGGDLETLANEEKKFPYPRRRQGANPAGNQNSLPLSCAALIAGRHPVDRILGRVFKPLEIFFRTLDAFFYQGLFFFI